MDNLFTRQDILVKLRELGFGAAGTVRTTATKREELKQKTGTEAQKKRKEPNRGLDTSLSELKTVHGAQIPWGTMYVKIKDSRVLQFAWKDQQVVLFMTTVNTDCERVIRKRRRPIKTSTNAITSRASFGDSSVKELEIPEAIDLYNHYMNGVDVGDQLQYSASAFENLETFMTLSTGYRDS